MIIKNYEIRVNKKLFFQLREKRENFHSNGVCMRGLWGEEREEKYFN
jgi:hypothetical protein